MSWVLRLEVYRDNGDMDSYESWDIGDVYAYRLIRNLLREMFGRGTITPS